MRKDQEVVEMANWQMEQLAKELGMKFTMHKSGPWVTIQLLRVDDHRGDDVVFLQVKERGWLAAVKEAHAKAQELTNHPF